MCRRDYQSLHVPEGNHTRKDDISDDINENTTDQEEAQASPNQEIGDGKQNIEDENSDINPSDGVA